jgi:hypothetical protein
MLDIHIKQYIRDYLNGKMQEQRQLSRVYRTVPAIIIRDDELETFIDEFWIHLQDSAHKNAQNETTRTGESAPGGSGEGDKQTTE